MRIKAKLLSEICIRPIVYEIGAQSNFKTLRNVVNLGFVVSLTSRARPCSIFRVSSNFGLFQNEICDSYIGGYIGYFMADDFAVVSGVYHRFSGCLVGLHVSRVY